MPLPQELSLQMDIFAWGLQPRSGSYVGGNFAMPHRDRSFTEATLEEPLSAQTRRPADPWVPTPKESQTPTPP